MKGTLTSVAGVISCGALMLGSHGCGLAEEGSSGTGRGGSRAAGGGNVGGAGGATGVSGSAGSVSGSGGMAGAGMSRGGSSGAAGSPAIGGSSGSGGSPGSGGGSGSGGVIADAAPGDGSDGSMVRETGVPGTDAAADRGSTGDGPTAERFSFFVTSLAAMRALSGNQNGFGGDLRFGKPTGLEGADEICRQISERSMPGNGKTWRAFLSVSVGPVNAIDRIGNGPWYDRRGRLFAMSKANLATGALRPTGADPAIINDLPNEDGIPNHNPEGTVVDNHHFMTGSTAMGTLHTTGLTGTCQDWTTTTGTAGRPRCGFSWPRMIGSTMANGAHWISGIDEAGCAAEVFITGTGGAPPGATGVGSGGGYGGIYCFALTP